VVEMRDPRRMCRRGVIYPTMICNYNCSFCYYKYMTVRPTKSLQELKVLLKNWKEVYELEAVDITGGEPTIYSDIVPLVEFCSSIDLKPTIITNGSRPELIKDLKEAGIDDFLVSIHGTNKIHNRMSDNTKAHAKVLQFIEELSKFNIPYRINCVVTKWNMENLPDFAKEILTWNYRPKMLNLILFNPHPGTLWSDKINVEFQAKYSEASVWIKQFIDIVNEEIWTNVRYIPLCFMKNYEHHVTNFLQNIYEPYEWENLAVNGISGPRYEQLAKETEGKVFGTNERERIMLYLRRKIDCAANVFVKACLKCRNRFICDGIYLQYLNAFGDQEFQAVEGEPIVDPIFYRLKDLRWLD
jgi:MoaA/NifB/PqqE/SkfB family radical SAM enzyme